MGARGRPTPQPEGYADRSPERSRPDINPYLDLHREFGRPLVPSAELLGCGRKPGTLFGRDGQLVLEIGSGNGEFMVELARRNPQYNVLGIEIRYKRTVLCARKIRAAGIENALVARYHAAFLHDVLEPACLVGIVVNHPDPWPKDRHEKNRLVSRWFLEDVATFLVPGGWLRVKSDFAPNCDRVVELLDRGPDGEVLPRLPLSVTGRSADVNGVGAPWADDIMTNYQQKMLRKGVAVHAIEAVRTEEGWNPSTGSA